MIPNFDCTSEEAAEHSTWLAFKGAPCGLECPELAHIFRSLQSGVTVGLEGEAEIVGTRLGANDRQVEICNKHARPSGADYLRSAEEVARGIKKGSSVASITRDLRLPAFKHSNSDPYAWPRPDKPVDFL